LLIFGGIIERLKSDAIRENEKILQEHQNKKWKQEEEKNKL
jgi:hypothetical protein